MILSLVSWMLWNDTMRSRKWFGWCSCKSAHDVVRITAFWTHTMEHKTLSFDQAAHIKCVSTTECCDRRYTTLWRTLRASCHKKNSVSYIVLSTKIWWQFDRLCGCDVIIVWARWLLFDFCYFFAGAEYSSLETQKGLVYTLDKQGISIHKIDRSRSLLSTFIW